MATQNTASDLGAMGITTELVMTGDIVIRPEWNSRKVHSRTDIPKKNGKSPDRPDAEAEMRSIVDSMVERLKAKKTPNHTAINIRRGKDGELLLKSGSRRVEAAKLAYAEMGEKGGGPVLSIIEEYAEDTDTDDRVDNLTENLLRANLNAWETAEGLAELVRLSGKKPTQIAKKVGLSVSYVANLLRCKEKLSDEMWAAYKASGGTMPQRHLLAVASKPRAKQAEAYNEIVQAEKGGRPPGGGDNKPRAKGKPTSPDAKVNPDGTIDVAFPEMYANLREAKAELHPMFAYGVKYALDVCSFKNLWNIKEVVKSGLVGPGMVAPGKDEDDEADEE